MRPREEVQKAFDQLAFGSTVSLRVAWLVRAPKRLPIVCMSLGRKNLNVGGWNDFSLTSPSISDCCLDQRLCVSLCVPKLLSAGETDSLSVLANAAPFSAMTLHIQTDPFLPPHHGLLPLCPSHLHKHTHVHTKSPLCPLLCSFFSCYKVTPPFPVTLPSTFFFSFCLHCSPSLSLPHSLHSYIL